MKSADNGSMKQQNTRTDATDRTCVIARLHRSLMASAMDATRPSAEFGNWDTDTQARET